MVKERVKLDKLELKSKNLTEENIGKLSTLFPELLTEVEKEGKLIKTIDLDKLKELVGDFASDEETYALNWVGKRDSKRKIAEPLTKTLRPVIKDSVDFENTKNLYVEGDNFEALKLLKESYLNSIKIIYIDPPYNTGKDFVYKDDFSVSKEDYNLESGVIDKEGNKLTNTNFITQGFKHSFWASMIYERLKVAHDLLKEDGLIFISIDENELYNLRHICNEIFGESCFVAELVWNTHHSQQQGLFTIYHEYILVYSKKPSKELENFNGGEGLIDAGALKKISKANPESEFNFPAGVRCEAKDGTSFNGTWGDGEKVTLVKGKFIIEGGKTKFPITLSAGWTQKNQMQDLFYGNKKVLDTKGQLVKEFYFTSTGKLKCIKERSKITPSSILEDFGTVSNSSEELSKLMNGNFFDRPKPVKLIKYLLDLTTQNEDIILDFFSGSATTAHAVMQLNAKDGGNRQFIMVQLPEETQKESEAHKAGYKNICEIGEERIRRAAKKIKEEVKEKNKQTKLNEEKIDVDGLDVGFKVFHVDSSNMKDVYYNPKSVDQKTLGNFKDNIKDDRTPDDLLYQVLLDWAIPISSKIRVEKIKNKKVFVVETDSGESWLAACFDEGINQEIVKEIAEFKPTKMVFRDSSFKNDSDKVNCEEYLKHRLPNTEMKVI